MPKTLLVVDDSATIREAAKLALTGEGWSVTEATSSHEAFSVLRSESPDAVLCDVALGEEDGYELCRAIHGLPEGAGVPVILMGSKVSEAAARAAGAAGTLPKPFGSDELADALRTALGTGTFELELSELDLAAPAPQVAAAGERGGPGDEEELEIIDLSSDEEYEELELLEDLEPVALAPARPAPAQPSDLALADLENFPGLTEEGEQGTADEPEPASDEEGVEEGVTAEDAGDSSFGWEESAFEGTELPPADSGEVPRVESFVLAATEPDESVQATPSAPQADLLAESVARSAAQAVRDALDSSLSAERLLPAVEAVVERVVWEVVPPLAERLIQEAIERLRQEPPEF